MPGDDKQQDLLKLPAKAVIINVLFPFLRGKEVISLSKLSTHWNKEIKSLSEDRKFWLKVLERDFGYKEDPNPQYQYSSLDLKKMYSYIATLEQNNPSRMKWLRQNILETGIHYPPLHAKDITQDEWDNHIKLLSFYWGDVVACGNKEFHAEKIKEDLTEYQKSNISPLDYVARIIEVGNKKLIQEELKYYFDESKMPNEGDESFHYVCVTLLANNKLDPDFFDIIFKSKSADEMKSKKMQALAVLTNVGLTNVQSSKDFLSFIKKDWPRYAKDVLEDLSDDVSPQDLEEIYPHTAAVVASVNFHDNALAKEIFELAEKEMKSPEIKKDFSQRMLSQSQLDELRGTIASVKDSETIKWLIPKILSVQKSKDDYGEWVVNFLIDAVKNGNVALVDYILDSDIKLEMKPTDKVNLFTRALLEPKLLNIAKSLLDPKGGNLSYFKEKTLTQDQVTLISNIVRIGNLPALKWLIDDKKIPISSKEIQDYFCTALKNGQFHIAEWLQNEKKLVLQELPLDTLFSDYIRNGTEIGKSDYVLALIHWLTCGEGDNQHVDPLELKPIMMRLYDDYDMAYLFFVAESLDQLKQRSLKQQHSIEQKM